MSTIIKNIVALLAVASIGTAGCSADRVGQCNTLIGKVDAARAQVGHATAGASHDIDAMARSVSSAEAEVQRTRLEDAKLRGYQADYVETLGRISNAVERVQEASGKDVAGMEADLRDMRSATRDEKRIVSEIETYCKTGG